MIDRCDCGQTREGEDFCQSAIPPQTQPMARRAWLLLLAVQIVMFLASGWWVWHAVEGMTR